jgi:hypothetical protein
MKRCTLALLLAFASGAFAAPPTPIYRCGQTYTQTPCADGHVIESSDPRSAAQRAEARRVAEREKQRAAQLDRDKTRQAASAPDAASAPVAASTPVPSRQARQVKAKGAASQPGVVFITPRPAQK